MHSTERRPGAAATTLLLTLLYCLSLPQLARAGLHSRGCHRVGRIVEIDDPDCEFMSVKVNACAGYCMSFSFYDPIERRMKAESSTCCRMDDSEEVVVELTCEKENRVVRIPTALTCKCAECANDISRNAASLFL
ncbi:hypothetical protein PFISCL1PPCAC_1008, partial [Pristionchus fissidentatus]